MSANKNKRRSNERTERRTEGERDGAANGRGRAGTSTRTRTATRTPAGTGTRAAATPRTAGRAVKGKRGRHGGTARLGRAEEPKSLSPTERRTGARGADKAAGGRRDERAGGRRAERPSERRGSTSAARRERESAGAPPHTRAKQGAPRAKHGAARAKSAERPTSDLRLAPRRANLRNDSAGSARGGQPRTGSRTQPAHDRTRRAAPRFGSFEGAMNGEAGGPVTPRARKQPMFDAQRAASPKHAPRTALPERPVRELSAEPHPGHFLLTTRQGSEQDLVEELSLLGVVDPPARMIAPAIVLAPKVPKRDKRPVELTFARQGFPVLQSVKAHDLEQIAARISRSLRGQLERAQQYALHVFVPDSDLGNPLSALADELDARIAAKLAEALPAAVRVDDASLRRLGSLPLAQVCLLDPERAAAGVTYSNAAISLARGGRTRVRVTGDFPSRAARKLEEALAWLGVEPSPGDLCVDLGAAPGGWTYVLSERRARVIAVDPAQLRPEIAARKGVRHVCESAFTFTPEAEVDWLFCDMAWRPLEAAALLAKWGRKRWARMLVANIKLPMKRKAELIERVRQVLRDEGGWKHVRTKQLYHDRDEITLTAHRG